MILLTPLFLWSQDDGTRCYSREQREVIASHNIQRLQCFEELEITDSLIESYEGSIAYHDLQLKQLTEANTILINNTDSLSSIVTQRDIKIKKLKNRKNVFKLLFAAETGILIIILKCLL
jgi:hypothetical protein